VTAPARAEQSCEFILGDTPQQQAAALVDRLIEEKLI
jgi:hypothetical protein